MNDLRSELIDALKKEHIGPDPGTNPDFLQENGEEILNNILPTTRYSAGILYPQEIDEEITDILDEDEKDPQISDVEDIEEVIKQTNKYQQSAFAVSFAISIEQSFEVLVKGAFYKSKKQKNSDYKNYYREPIECVELVKKEEWEKIIANEYYKELVFNDDLIGLELRIFKRFKRGKTIHLTASIVNRNGIINDIKGINGTFFQSELSLKTELGFSVLPNKSGIFQDEDTLINELLYRKQLVYALGHGVSVNWDDTKEKISEISSTFIPFFEIKPILPKSFEGLRLSMKEMSDESQFDNAVKSLEILLERYDEWLDDINSKLNQLEEKYHRAANLNVDRIKLAKKRIQEGLEILQTDSEIAKAFMLMNEAMLRQQLRHNLPISHWIRDKGLSTSLKLKYNKLPVIDDEDSWFDKENRVYGQWRPFQIAFILLNIKSMADKQSEDRKILDLIWFPTGGGKTEAYLGLSSFSIFLRRIRDKRDNGTDVIMRYTLRLLTTQQFERAASLIVACDFIRSKNVELLGDIPISIGLWVGSGTTPNNNKKAIELYDGLYQGTIKDNPFKVVKCPNCGAEMGLLNFNAVPPIKGYRKTSKKIKFVCGNIEIRCHYSDPKNPLPIYVVDEDIYENTPTLVLGTVDKFANIPFLKKSIKLFGFKDNDEEPIDPPNLFIQDELHLISGPLGSTVGHYETIIDYFVTRHKSGKEIKPKYIASTATISRARKQCNSLYACGEENVFQFPPQGIDEGDSFFAYKDVGAKGRLYTGLMISGKNSKTVGTIRTYAKLLYAVNDLKNQGLEVDPYWTNIAYFNNIRQLGQVVNWINQDVQEFLKILNNREHYKKFEVDGKPKRYLRKHIELTSRINSASVSENLHKLDLSVMNDPNDVIDVALATNMISVGLDVSRLGLMTVNGQPKTTSEYIQTTSRVGRDFKKRPGLVVVLYDSSRSRDRSHFENFQYYHSKIYAHVEPTSVTSFSSPVMNRYMHAVIISILRLSPNFGVNIDKPTPPSDEDMHLIKKILLNRINRIDASVSKDAEEVIDNIFKYWHQGLPTAYTINGYNTEDVPLMYPSNILPNDAWKDRSFATPNSMRNVDQLSQIEIIVGEE